MSDLLSKIRSAGYWDVAIKPATYVNNRVPYDELDELINAAVVRIRGWPVPYVDPREPLLRDEAWIGQDVDALTVGHFEAWRFHTSGQFNHLRAVGADWRHENKIVDTPSNNAKTIEVWEVLFYITEVFELAARLALSPAGDKEMVIQIRLHGLYNRGLVVGQRTRAEFIEPYVLTRDRLEQQLIVSREDLVAEPKSHAVDMSREFFLRFGWKPPRDQLIEHQRELTDEK